MRAPLRKGNQRGEISRDSLLWVSVAEDAGGAHAGGGGVRICAERRPKFGRRPRKKTGRRGRKTRRQEKSIRNRQQEGIRATVSFPPFQPCHMLAFFLFHVVTN